jgi:nucleoid DNA-binding protein
VTPRHLAEKMALAADPEALLKNGLSRSKLEAIIRSTFESMGGHIFEALDAGETVKFPGFGTFKLATVTRPLFGKERTKVAKAIKFTPSKRGKGKHMEKYGAELEKPNNTKIASPVDRCPRCGAASPERHCPIHGTEPFEKRKESGK